MTVIIDFDRILSTREGFKVKDSTLIKPKSKDDHDGEVELEFHVYQKFLALLHGTSRLILILGAGISVSSGIPDFRSSDGLYNKLESRYPGLLKKGQHMFDASILHSSSDPEAMRSAYFSFMAELKGLCDNARPSPTHHWIAWLKERGKIMRIYTQNIDGLEVKVGLIENEGLGPGSVEISSGDHSILTGKKEVFATTTTTTITSTIPTPTPTPISISTPTPTTKAFPSTILLHGSLNTLACTLCQHCVPFTSPLQAELLQGNTLQCPMCEARCQSRTSLGKRSLPIGLLTPSILLYNDHGRSTGINNGRNFTCGYKMTNYCEEINHWMTMDSQKPNFQLLLQSPDHRRASSPALSRNGGGSHGGSHPEMVLVLGTSCKVIGVKKWIKTLSSLLHSIEAESKNRLIESKSNETQTKITNYLSARKSLNILELSSQKLDQSASERAKEMKRLLKADCRYWIVYMNKTPLAQKEWASVFDVQWIGDCDVMTGHIKKTLMETYNYNNQVKSQKTTGTIIKTPSLKSEPIIVLEATNRASVETISEKRLVLKEDGDIPTTVITTSFSSASSITTSTVSPLTKSGLINTPSPASTLRSAGFKPIEAASTLETTRAIAAATTATTVVSATTATAVSPLSSLKKTLVSFFSSKKKTTVGEEKKTEKSSSLNGKKKKQKNTFQFTQIPELIK